MHNHIRLHKLSDCAVFFDFDNTITSFDVLDDLIEKFSINKDWVKLEERWKQGKIGSLECLSGQLKGIRITKPALARYLSKVTLTPGFPRLISLLKREGIKTAILSDDFSFVINSVLRKNRISGIKIYANRLKFAKDRLTPSFPHTYKRCAHCAHCKRKNLLKHNLRDKIIIYIGDGASDICPAEEADIVFAKGKLLEHFRRKKLLCAAFKDFRDIYDSLRSLER
ncbi:MAG: MtnX-like HAD-IB family phosphatase [Candidatus Omnitrophica bacterium]|nr:MtnX-like HAD-IB family phosphatase [Candidatus Omnitrophota bacterium]MDD5236871.1 MtnX-like HAD-IB family phosphatase [Candidatus Omnitrophota bacterium]MDD5610279.1 MtnX-like HAD-IB family phosphatase [Candidatus Omnitrophota bacterium]